VVPQLGESVVEATVAKWLKKEGDRVSVGEPVVELETEKIDLEVGASHAGVLSRIAQPEGRDVKIGEVLGVIEDDAAGDQKTGGETRTTTAPAGQSTAPAAVEEHPGAAASAADAGSASQATEKPRATASARRLAEEHEVDLGTLRGTGESGRVTRQDVESFVKGQPRAESAVPVQSATVSASLPPAESQPLKMDESTAPDSQPIDAKEKKAPAPASQPSDSRPPAPDSRPAQEPKDGSSTRIEERIKMSRRRQTIARRLVEAQRTAAMLTTFNEVDMTAVQDIRRRRKEAFKARYGVGLGLSSFFIKAAVAALEAYPRLNAEIQGDEMVMKRYYDIGVAVGASEGLVVPVLRDADRMTFAEIESGIKDFARRAEDGTLTLDDLRGGTFTITNGGVFGSLLSTPILNPPQVGILGLHKIEDRAVPQNGQVVIRPMMYVALSYDHRIVDGLEAVQFLVRVKELVEDPATLLLES
jgi:2-oxoglutarate dehydrogenase E2 component (dihydrolipoamide succinyltransferase)